MVDEKIIRELTAKLEYLSKWMPDIWLALKQKGIDMSNKDIALIGSKIRSISGNSDVDIYLPFCNYIPFEQKINHTILEIENPIIQLSIIEISKARLMEIEEDVEAWLLCKENFHMIIRT